MAAPPCFPREMPANIWDRFHAPRSILSYFHSILRNDNLLQLMPINANSAVYTMVQLSSGCLFVASSAGLVLFCLGADHIIFKWEDRWLKLSYGVSLRAVSDSVVHGLVGGWCWVNVLLLTSSEGLSWAARIGQVALCVAMATTIDLDHLIEAKSFSIKVLIIIIG